MSLSALSDYAENGMLNLLLRATPLAPPSTLYFSLHKSDPSEAGVGGEVSTTGTGYARVAVANNTTNFAACAFTGAPVKTNSTTITFPAAVATAWGMVTHWACYTAATGATEMIAHGELATPRYVAIEDIPKIPAGALSLSFSNGSGGGITEYVQRKLLDHLFGGTVFVPPALVYAGFGTALTGENLTEWSSTLYTRKPCVFTAASGGVSPNTGEVVITNEYQGADDVTLTHYGLWDEAAAGNLLLVGPLVVPRTVKTYDSVRIPTGGFTATFE